MTSFADNVASARVKELERQVVALRQLVLQSNHVLVDVHAALRSSGDARLSERITGLTRRMEHIIDRQQEAIDGDPSVASHRPTTAYSSADITTSTSQFTKGGAAVHASKAAVKEVVDKVLHAAARIADSWLSSKHKTVTAAMGLPNDAFAEFDARPTDESLQSFLASYRDAVGDVDRVLGTTEDSPFRGASQQRVADLIASMIESALFTEDTAGHVQQPTRPATEPAPSAPPAMERPMLAPPALQQQHAAGLSGTPPARGRAMPMQTPSAVRTSLSGPVLAEAAGKPSHTRIAERSALDLLPPSSGAVTPSVASQPASTPRCSTPSRFYGAKHDSSQMQSIFGGETQSSLARKVNTTSPEVAALQSQLAQLELQMTMATRRESGSEAKYYALNKKIQTVRAELLRLQRAEAEDAAIRDAIAQQHRQRDVSTTRAPRAFR